jgi:hypothetical protein
MMKPTNSMTRLQTTTDDAHASRTIFRLLLSLMVAGRLAVTVVMGASCSAGNSRVVIRG